MHRSNRAAKATRVTWVSFFMNVLLTSFKLVAGIVGKSGAMIADGVHSLSDFFTDILLLVGFRFVDRPADKTHDYGHGKVETLISAVIGIALLIVGLRIFWGGAHNIIKSLQGEILLQPGWIAFFAAVIAIITKEWMYRYTKRIGKEIDSPALVANAWHHRSDAFSSVGTMIGIGGAIVLGEQWHILDPIAAVVVSVFIMKVAVSISSGCVNELLEASLNEETENRILEIVKSIPGVKNPHNMKTRKIGTNIAIDIHIEVKKSLDITQAHGIATTVEQTLKESFGENTFVSVHVEPFGS